MKRTVTLLTLLFGIHATFFAQNICLEKLAPRDTFYAALIPSMAMCDFTAAPFADFNQDGKLDMAWTGTYNTAFGSAYYMGISLGDGMGNFVDDSSWVLAIPGHLQTGDFNEDGIMDVAFLSAAGGCQLFTCLGNGHFSSASVSVQAYMPVSFTVGDFDGDNHLDILVSDFYSTCRICYVPGNGNGTFGTPVHFTVSSCTQRFLNGDFTNDGLLDAVVGSALFINNSGGSFTNVPTQMPQGLFDVGDFNQDGNLDLIGADTIYLGSGFGTFPTHVAYSVTPGFTNYWRTADMNGDGKSDLLGRRGDGVHDTLMIFTGNGNATFSSTNVNIPLDSISSLGGVGDLDNNGMLDLSINNSQLNFEHCESYRYSIMNRMAHIFFASTSFCQGDSLQLSVNTTGQILWDNGDTVSSIYVSSAGTYSVTTTTSSGCSSSDSVTIQSIAATTFASINSNNIFCFYSSPFALNSGAPAGGTYSGPGVSNGIFNPQAAGVGAHTLVYTYAGPGGCTGSDSLQVTVDLCLGVSENDVEKKGLLIYPNPNNGNFIIATTEKEFEVSVYDVLGNEIYSATNEKNISLNAQASGIYLVRVTAGNKIYSQKIIVE